MTTAATSSVVLHMEGASRSSQRTSIELSTFWRMFVPFSYAAQDLPPTVVSTTPGGLQAMATSSALHLQVSKKGGVWLS